MFSFFIQSIKSDTVENRRFIEKSTNFTDSWEIGGVSEQVGKDFYLIPENKTNSYGGIYFTSRLSAHNYEARVSLRFIPHEKSTGMNAIWITKDYHQDSQVFGGPLSFDGVALLSTYNGTHLETELRKNDKKGRFVSYQYFPSSFVPLVDHKVTYRIVYKDKIVNVYIITGGVETHAFSQTPLSDIRKYFLSVTGRSGKRITQIIVGEARYLDLLDEEGSIVKNIVTMNVENEAKPTPAPTPTPIAKDKDNYTVTDVLDEIEIFDLFSSALTANKDVREMIWNEMVPFSDSWQRRSIGIVRKAKHMKESLQIALNNTYLQVLNVKNDIEKDLAQLRTEMQDIENELYYGISDGFELHNKIRDEKHQGLSGISKILFNIGIIEAVIGIVAIMFKSCYDGAKSKRRFN